MRGHCFRPLRDRRRLPAASVQPNLEGLLALLSRFVIEPFGRITDNRIVAIPLVLAPSTDGEDPAANPGHPACLEYDGTDYCRESWQCHMAELARRGRTHWHRCDYDRLCAIVPVVHKGRCLAAVKLACTSSSMSAEDFKRYVELLGILVENLATAHDDFLSRIPQKEPSTTQDGGSPRSDESIAPEQHAAHPQVLRAIAYISEHLSDPKLSVGRIAQELEINPNYLSQIFADRVGQRMSQFIATRRVDLAKKLLTETNHQIKRIAHETGHANPNWFCYVFRALTGLAPGEYRRIASGDQTDRTDHSQR